MSTKRWIKLSYDISEEDPLPPGIPAFSRKTKSSIKGGDISNVSNVCFCNHSGTHIDAPLHFVEDGLALTEFDINDFHFTSPVLVDIPLSDGQLVRPEHLEQFKELILPSDLLLIRTGFCKHRASDPERYRLDGPGFSEAAAIYTVQNFPKLRCVGLDAVSLAAMREVEEGIKAHQVLLAGGRRFMIIEDMDLSGDLSGITEVLALPLLIAGIDGSQCTIVAR